MMTSNNSIGEEKKEDTYSVEKAMPAELLGRSIRQLTILDRLRCERVYPRWSRTIWELGWTDVCKLHHTIVFEGTTQLQRERFTAENLISIIRRVAPTLVELDLASFGFHLFRQRQLIPEVAATLQHCPKLEKLDIRGFDLTEFLAFLPSNLRQLKFDGERFSVQTLEALSRRCPNLEEVNFRRFKGINPDNAGALIGSFPRQKKLELFYFMALHQDKQGALASIGKLKELEELWIWSGVDLDEVSIEAIAEGCQKLRLLKWDVSKVPEKLLFHLAKMTQLTVLDVSHGADAPEFSDAVLQAIAQRGQLKKLHASGSPITDDSVVYLVERCKSLVSLVVSQCPQITERSLEAVVAEVKRRHGSPPRTFPTDPHDPEIFYFSCSHTGIKRLVGAKPWLRFF